MPSVAMPERSEAADTTTLWPMVFTGRVPVCLRVMVNSLHEDGTVIEPTLNCIASLPSMVVLQFSTVASGLPLALAWPSAGLGAGSGPVAAPVAGALPAGDAGVVAGAGVAVVSDGGSVLSPHA